MTHVEWEAGSSLLKMLLAPGERLERGRDVIPIVAGENDRKGRHKNSLTMKDTSMVKGVYTSQMDLL